MKVFLMIFLAFIVSACAAKNKNVKPDMPASQESMYAAEKQKEVLGIIRTPPAPIRTQGSIMRVLFLPYVDENGVLHGPSYKFVKMDDGQWILGEYLLDAGESLKELEPLKQKKEKNEAESTAPR